LCPSHARISYSLSLQPPAAAEPPDYAQSASHSAWLLYIALAELDLIVRTLLYFCGSQEREEEGGGEKKEIHRGQVREGGGDVARSRNCSQMTKYRTCFYISIWKEKEWATQGITKRNFIIQGFLSLTCLDTEFKHSIFVS
jgi:hypothetical protein